MDYRTTVFAGKAAIYRHSCPGSLLISCIIPSDVPGLLEGAHEGLGLGHEFLRHVQRCRALVHVIDGTSPEPMGDYRAINLEVRGIGLMTFLQ